MPLVEEVLLCVLTFPKAARANDVRAIKTGIDYMERPVNLSCSGLLKISRERYREHKKKCTLLLQVFTFVMFLYNLFVYFTIREKSYLIHSLSFCIGMPAGKIQVPDCFL